jgi:arabinose-5-phosphate isomerase
MDDTKLQNLGIAVIKTEADAVAALIDRITEGPFVRACHLMLACQGRVVVIGMGKSGHIGSKIAATLASTGTPAFFVHPGEASHGDLGMITAKDVVLALSNSGETDEILTILPIIKRLNVPLITLTGNADSRLARAATANIDVCVGTRHRRQELQGQLGTTGCLCERHCAGVLLLVGVGQAHPGERFRCSTRISQRESALGQAQ